MTRARCSGARLCVFGLGMLWTLFATAGCAAGRADRPGTRAPEPRTTQASATRSATADGIGTPNDDVVLEVPRLWVDSIGLQVDSLIARLSLDANVINLVAVTAGVDVSIDSVMLEIQRVSAEAYLYVDLDNVARLVDRTISTLERNPEIVTHLLSAVDTLVGTVGGVAAQAVGPGGVLTRTVNQLGQTVQQVVGSTGEILEQTLDAGGQVLSQRTIGRLGDLRLLSETTNAAGETVRRVQDQAGRMIEYVTDTAGRITSARIVSGGR